MERSSIKLQSMKANGIRHQIAAVNEAYASNDLRHCPHPLVMFLNGWPESWYSWCHQLLALQHQKCYVGCAPDMRGYGLTNAPKDKAVQGCY
eukprot:9703692-Ditylum_brightwellii.AAC.1